MSENSSTISDISVAEDSNLSIYHDIDKRLNKVYLAKEPTKLEQEDYIKSHCENPELKKMLRKLLLKEHRSLKKS